MNKTLLQLAMDGAYDGRTVEDAIDIVSNKLCDFVDIIELGSSMIYRWGMLGIIKMHENFPDKIILADMKIMDGGKGAARMACQLGADIVTVMGVTHNETIKNVCDEVHKHNAKVMVDFMCVNNAELKDKVNFCENINVDYICAHYAVDLQGKKENDDRIEEISKCINNCQLAIAGGINKENIDSILPYHPSIIICGKSIYSARDPFLAAKSIKDKIICQE